MIVKFAELKFTLYTEYTIENVLNIFVRYTYVYSKVIQRESDSIYHGEPWINITMIATNIFKNHFHMTQINIFMTQKITIIATNIFKKHSHMTQINIFMIQKINVYLKKFKS